MNTVKVTVIALKRGGLPVKEDMYTYHYYKHRAVHKGVRVTEYIFHFVAGCFVVFFAALAVKLVK